MIYCKITVKENRKRNAQSVQKVTFEPLMDFKQNHYADLNKLHARCRSGALRRSKPLRRAPFFGYAHLRREKEKNRYTMDGVKTPLSTHGWEIFKYKYKYCLR